MAINYGDWQSMPDYREGWVDKHKSGIVGLGRALDVTTYIPGLNKVSDFAHEGTGRVMTAANTYLSPLVKTVNKGLDVIDPTAKWLKKNTILGDVNNFVEEKPADALAVAAATYFSAGALSGAATGAGAAAAPAASGGAGAAGGMAGAGAAGSAAITPAFASGVGAGGAVTAGVGASAITPAFGAAGLSIAPAAVSGGLGAAGTAAAGGLLTPAFASWGGAGTGAGLLSTAKSAYGKFSKANDYYSNMKRFSDANRSPTDTERYNAQSNAFAKRIIDDPQQSNYRDRVASQIMMNKFGMRK